MNAKVGSLNVDLTLETARFEQGTKRAQQNLKTLETNMRGLGKTSDSMRMGMQQLGFQLNDVATQFASGTKASMIFAQQSGQVIQAIQMMSGGTSRFAAFMSGPWGIALSVGAIALGTLISKFFEADDALEKVKFSTGALGDAQGILGNVMDLTTGKINTQNKALIALAQAQIVVARVEAQTRAASAKRELTDISAPRREFSGGLGGGLNFGPRTTLDLDQRIVKQVLSGVTDSKTAIQNLERFRSSGRINGADFARAVQAIANLGVETANIGVFDEADKLLNGQGGRGLLKPGKADKAKKDSGPSASEIQNRFNDKLTSLTQQTLSARQSIATSAEEQAELELRSVEWARIQTKREIDTDKDFNEAQKADLKAQLENLAQAEREKVARDLAKRQEEAAANLASQQASAARDRLQYLATLAETDADRQRIALELLDLDERERRLALERIRDSETRSDADRALARRALGDLDANAGLNRAAVMRGTETRAQSYARSLSQTPGQINEAIDGIKMAGLDSLNDGLAQAIAGTAKLGDVFKSVAQQIIADLVRIAIRQTIVSSLANSLGLGGSVPGLGGVDYAGLTNMANTIKVPGFASGTSFAPGGLSLVGEHGPELVNLPRGSKVHSNSQTRGMMGGKNVFDLRGAVVTSDLLAQMDAIASNRADFAVIRNNSRQTRRSQRSLAR